MSFPQSIENDSKLNIHSHHSMPINFCFFDPIQIDPGKHFVALEILQDHLKYVFDKVINITDFHYEKFVIKMEDSEMIKSIYKFLDVLNERNKNEIEISNRKIKTFTQKIEKINKKISQEEHEIASPQNRISQSTKSILEEITKPKLDYIYYTLAKGKDKLFVTVIEALVSMLLNKEILQPQEVEKTIRIFDILKERMLIFNISTVNQKIIDKAFLITSNAMEEIEKLESNKLFPPKKIYSNLIPFGKWIISIINDSKNILEKEIRIKQIEKYKNKRTLYEGIINLYKNSDNPIHFKDEITKVDDLIKQRVESTSILSNLIEKFNFDKAIFWENLMNAESESIKTIYTKKETKVRRTIEEENNIKTQFEESAIVPSLFCGFCSWFRRSQR